MVNYTRDDLIMLIGKNAVQIASLQEALTQILAKLASLAEESRKLTEENKKLKEGLQSATIDSGAKSPEGEAVQGLSDRSTSETERQG